ncbi:MAG: hypothetical protein K6T90_12275, partial [Leptolyngbyaceae cyanobacterium HOT.MB2.61]|nr:hypothetical protein [Leptolyngbyaceae cyanobacterium HOT.MB2.61]
KRKSWYKGRTSLNSFIYCPNRGVNFSVSMLEITAFFTGYALICALFVSLIDYPIRKQVR